jgi:hypothetical protein
LRPAPYRPAPPTRARAREGDGELRRESPQAPHCGLGRASLPATAGGEGETERRRQRRTPLRAGPSVAASAAAAGAGQRRTAGWAERRRQYAASASQHRTAGWAERRRQRRRCGLWAERRRDISPRASSLTASAAAGYIRVRPQPRRAWVMGSPRPRGRVRGGWRPNQATPQQADQDRGLFLETGDAAGHY